MTLVATIFVIIFDFFFWHERSALQSVAFWRSTGTDVSGHYFHYFFPSPQCVSPSCPFLSAFLGPPGAGRLVFFSFSPSQQFLIAGVLGSKN